MVRSDNSAARGLTLAVSWGWQRQAAYRGLDRWIVPNRVRHTIVGCPFEARAVSQWGQVRCCSTYALACWVTIVRCTPANRSLASASVKPWSW